MKIKKNMQEHIDVLNRELRSYAANNPEIFYNQVVNTEEDYAQGSFTYRNFTVLFRCHDGCSGYSFLETPVFDSSDNLPVGTTLATYEALFKFPFSPILYSIYDIHNVLNDQNFRTLCFHNVIDEESATDAIREILDFLTIHTAEISKFNDDTAIQKTLFDNYISDELTFDEDFNTKDFEENIEESVDLHNLLMYVHMILSDGLYKFILTGNHKKLEKQYEKAKRKNDLIVFERRYMDYLYKNNFPVISIQAKEKSKTQSKKKNLTGFLNIVFIIVSFAFSFFAPAIFSEICVNIFQNEGLFLGVNLSGIVMAALLLGSFLALNVIAHKIPFIDSKINRSFHKKYDKAIAVISLILIIGSFSYIAYSYANSSLVLKDDGLYWENTIVEDKTDIEFIYIEGSYYYNDNEEFEYRNDTSDKDLLFVINGEYENYYYTEIYEGDGYVTNDILNKISEHNYKITTYKAFEDFAEKYNIDT